jgi:hypothetical protein
MVRGRRGSGVSALSSAMASAPQAVVGADMGRLDRREGNAVRARTLRPTAPRPTRRKKSKRPLRGAVCLWTTGGLIRVRWGYNAAPGPRAPAPRAPGGAAPGSDDRPERHAPPAVNPHRHAWIRCPVHHPPRGPPNATLHLPPEAGARDERRLEAVRCKRFIGIQSCFQ